MNREQDFVRSLGLPFLAHRLRRASELIMEGSSSALRRAGLSSPARSVSTLLLLRENGPTGVTEIAFRLRLSHPLIIKLVATLSATGLVRSERDSADQRRRLIALTDKGLAETARIDAFCKAIGDMFDQMFADTGVDLFAALERFEAAVEGVPIGERLAFISAEDLLRRNLETENMS